MFPLLIFRRTIRLGSGCDGISEDGEVVHEEDGSLLNTCWHGDDPADVVVIEEAFLG